MAMHRVLTAIVVAGSMLFVASCRDQIVSKCVPDIALACVVDEASARLPDLASRPAIVKSLATNFAVNIAIAQHRLGKAEEVKQLIKSIEDWSGDGPSGRQVFLFQYSKVLAGIGGIDTPEADTARRNLLAALASAEANWSQDPSGAAEWLKHYSKAMRQLRLDREAVELLARRRKLLDQLRATIQPDLRMAYLLELTELQLQAGDVAGARSSVGTVLDELPRVERWNKKSDVTSKLLAYAKQMADMGLSGEAGTIVAWLDPLYRNAPEFAAVANDRNVYFDIELKELLRLRYQLAGLAKDGAALAIAREEMRKLTQLAFLGGPALDDVKAAVAIGDIAGAKEMQAAAEANSGAYGTDALERLLQIQSLVGDTAAFDQTVEQLPTDEARRKAQSSHDYCYNFLESGHTDRTLNCAVRADSSEFLTPSEFYNAVLERVLTSTPGRDKALTGG